MASDQISDQVLLFHAAARNARQRIRRDRRAATRKVRPLLDHIEEHLYDPELKVHRLKAACGVRDNSIAIYFHRDTGEPPSVYIRSRRMETAAVLLRHSELKVFRIGETVGYPDPVTFSRAFKRWAGISPLRYRKRSRAYTPSSEVISSSFASASRSPIWMSRVR